MRVVNIADLEAGARLLSGVPAHERPKLARLLFEQATIADECRQQTALPHPRFGTGTLMSAVSHAQRRMGPLDISQDFLSSLHVLTTQLLRMDRDQMT